MNCITIYTYIHACIVYIKLWTGYIYTYKSHKNRRKCVNFYRGWDRSQSIFIRHSTFCLPSALRTRSEMTTETTAKVEEKKQKINTFTQLVWCTFDSKHVTACWDGMWGQQGLNGGFWRSNFPRFPPRNNTELRSPIFLQIHRNISASRDVPQK